MNTANGYEALMKVLDDAATIDRLIAATRLDSGSRRGIAWRDGAAAVASYASCVLAKVRREEAAKVAERPAFDPSDVLLLVDFLSPEWTPPEVQEAMKRLRKAAGRDA